MHNLQCIQLDIKGAVEQCHLCIREAHYQGIKAGNTRPLCGPRAGDVGRQSCGAAVSALSDPYPAKFLLATYHPACSTQPATYRDFQADMIKMRCMKAPAVGHVQGMRRWPRCREASGGAWRSAACCSSSRTSCCWMCAPRSSGADCVPLWLALLLDLLRFHMHKRAVSDAWPSGLLPSSNVYTEAPCCV